MERLHADTFYGDIPCTRQLIEAEVQAEYEENTGKVIIECFKEKKICPQAILLLINTKFYRI